MNAPLLLLVSTACLALVAADNLNYFSKEFQYGQIEFPKELRYSIFNGPQMDVQKGNFLQASEALFAVAVRLKSVLDFSTDGGNFLMSPLSVAVALGQLLLGAKGESRRQLSEFLSTARKDGAGAEISDVEFHRQFKGLLALLDTSASQNGSNRFENYELHIANAFFIQPDLRMRPDYRHAVTDFYNCDIMPLNFRDNPAAAQKAVNDWVKVNTRGHIPVLLPYPLPPTTASLVANAIYFKGAWENPFDPKFTISGTFKINSKERVAVKYMRGQFELQYAESERLGCQMVVLPYKHKQASMHIFLPFDKDSDVRNFTAGLSIQDVVELKLASTERSVTLVMPKMTLTGQFSLKGPLARLQNLQRPAPPTAQTQRRPVRPVAVRTRGKRDSGVKVSAQDSPSTPLFLKKINTFKRQERGIQSEDASTKRAQDERSKTEVNVSKLETKEQVGNKFTESKHITENKYTPVISSSNVGESDLRPEDSIKTEIVTSSIMVPALPLIVMEVDKTYTVSLNKSHHSMNYSHPVAENFPSRQGEFDPNFQISSPLLYSYKPPVYSSQHRPNDKFQRPSLGLGSGQPGTGFDGHSDFIQDRISFPVEEGTTEKQILKRTNSPQQYPPFTTIQQNGKLDSASVIRPPGGVGGEQSSSGRPVYAGSKGDIQFDLTGVSQDSRFRIDDILHQMWLEVTETGTEAAAVSAGAVDYSGDVKLVLADRPFLLVILHEETRAALFWAVVMDPTGGAGLRTEDPLGRPSSAQSSVDHSTGR